MSDDMLKLHDYLPAIMPGDTVPGTSEFLRFYDPDTAQLLGPPDADVVDAHYQWEELRKDGANRYYTELINNGLAIEVSTAYLSGNHNWNGGPPLMWETMLVLNGTDFQTRYCNRRAALNGHLFMVHLLLRGGMVVGETNIEITAPEIGMPPGRLEIEP